MELTDLLKSIDIVEFISQFVDLEEKNGEFWGLSPFQDEKTPSFSVRRESGSWFDFSSGLGGNLYTFVRHYNRCSSREAINMIEQYAGFDGKVMAPRDKMSATLSCLKYAKPKATQKESKATVLPENYMERYEKNYDKLEIWEQEGISRASLDKFQVYYDGFSNRIVYPIRNLNGEIVNIGGRTLDPMWKEKKQRKYCYFYSWGTMDTIYGLAENAEDILKAKEIILFEGCKSVLLADTWGIKNTAAILTSHLNPHQMKILARLGCRVVFALDKGVRVTDDHNISKLKNYVNVEYVYDAENIFEEKEAPVDRGREAFKKVYEQRKRYR